MQDLPTGKRAAGIGLAFAGLVLLATLGWVRGGGGEGRPRVRGLGQAGEALYGPMTTRAETVLDAGTVWGRGWWAPRESEFTVSFDAPDSFAVDDEGGVYIVDQLTDERKLKKFDSSGRLLWSAPLPEAGLGPWECLEKGGADVDVDASGRVFCADAATNKLVVYAPDGRLLAQYDPPKRIEGDDTDGAIRGRVAVNSSGTVCMIGRTYRFELGTGSARSLYHESLFDSDPVRQGLFPQLIGRDDRLYACRRSPPEAWGWYHVWDWDLNPAGRFQARGCDPERFWNGVAAQGRLYSEPRSGATSLGADGRYPATVVVYDVARQKAHFFPVRVSPYHDWAVSRSGDYYIMDYGPPAAPGQPPRLQIRRYRTDWE